MEKWKCKFAGEKRENREMREFSRKLSDANQSFSRFSQDSLVENITRYEVTDTEKIRYVDVCSLYPYVLKMGIFPLGQPKIYIGEQWKKFGVNWRSSEF